MSRKKKPKIDHGMHYFDFYRLPEDERKAMIGEPLPESKAEGIQNVYYPFHMSEDAFNYGVRQGVLGMMSPICLRLGKKRLEQYAKGGGDVYWYKICVCSPDDMDLSLYFDHQEIDYSIPSEFMRNFDFSTNEYSYQEILDYAQSEIGGKMD